MNEKFACILILMLLGIAHCFASDEMLVVLKTDGSTMSYVLSSKPELTFQDGSMQIASNSETTSVALSDIDNFHFAEAPTAISNVSENEMRIVRSCNDELRIYGANVDASDVQVFDVSGKRVNASCSQINGGISVSLQSCPKGISLIKINNRSTIKIVKK